MRKIALKTFCLCFLLCFMIGLNSAPVYSSPTTLGDEIQIDSYGSDPDIAVDSEGSLHIAYVRGGATYYRKVLAPYTNDNNIGPMHLVGYGINPQIAVDSLNNPHVVFGKANYAYWKDSVFKEAEQAFSAWRKNLIAIDSKDQVYVVADRFYPRDVSVRVYKDGKAISARHTIGDDNPGGIDFMKGIYFEENKESDRLFLTWRAATYTYARTYHFIADPNLQKGEKQHNTENKYKFPNQSGDFSWCSVNPLDGSVHAVYTAAHSAGLFSSIRRDGKWNDLPLYAKGMGITSEPDYVNPVSAADRDGNVYITFVGVNDDAYYMVFNANDELQKGTEGINIMSFNNDNVGGKMTNPNVASRPDMSGAYVAWGEGVDGVSVASIGDISSFNKSVSGIYILLK